MNQEQEILVKRLKEAGLHTRRFLKVDDQKRAFESEWQKNPYEPSELDAEGCERWGIIGRTGLVPIDTDNAEMAEIIRKILPPTFETITPRRKLPHFYFAVTDGEVPNKTLFLKGDSKGSGEIRSQNEYLVAPGTEIHYKDIETGEEKTGRYTILHDRPIAKVEYAFFMEAVKPYLGSAPGQKITFKQMREGVPRGSRHAQGIKFATFLIGVKRFDEATALHAMREWNQLCKPPMDDHDLERMVKNAMGYVEGGKEEKAAAEKIDLTRYFTKKENGAIDKFVPSWLADDITKNHHFVTHRESWVIYRYQDGIYLPDGAATIHELCRTKLGAMAKDYYITEVEKHIRDTTFKRPEEFEPAPELLCVKNGILNTITKELKQHTPSTIFLSKLPAEYNPGANCPTVLKRLYEWTGGSINDMVKLIQFAGFCLYRNYFIRKVIIIHGEGGNGKTTFVLFLTRWLGEDSVVSVKVQKLEKRFTAARLFGKLANLCDDLPGTEWFSTGSFKQATGGAPIDAEKKFKDEFSYVPYAKMLFTGNRMPIVSDDTLAFWDRIALIAFGQRFEGDRVINREDLLKEMLVDEERSGFLNLALEGLASLLSTNEFFAMGDTEKTKKKYIKISDPVMAFGHERAMSDPTANTVKRTIYAAYADYCMEKGFPVKENNAFARSFKRVYPHIEDSEVVDEDGKRHNSWKGVALRPQDAEPPHESVDNPPQVTQIPHVSLLFKSIRKQLKNYYKIDIGEYPAKPTEPAETRPTEPPTAENGQELGVKHEKIEEKPATRVTEPERIAHPAINPPGNTQKAEPTTQDIVASVHSFRGSTIFKEKIAARAKCTMDRLNVVLEELEKKRAVRDMGRMVEVF